MTTKEIKVLITKTLTAAKPMFKTLDAIDEALHKSDARPDDETLLKWARKAAGAGNYIEKKFLTLSAMKKNEEVNKYEAVKLAVSVKNEKFTSAIADREASAYVADLRLTRDIFQGHLNSAVRTISIIRMHVQPKESKIFTAHL